jgi:hypothetical protein
MTHNLLIQLRDGGHGLRVLRAECIVLVHLTSGGGRRVRSNNAGKKQDVWNKSQKAAVHQRPHS